jgi:hypothetical protein
VLALGYGANNLTVVLANLDLLLSSRIHGVLTHAHAVCCRLSGGLFRHVCLCFDRPDADRGSLLPLDPYNQII